MSDHRESSALPPGVGALLQQQHSNNFSSAQGFQEFGSRLFKGGLTSDRCYCRGDVQNEVPGNACFHPHSNLMGISVMQKMQI